MNELSEVGIVTACCMVIVMIFGANYDALFREHKVVHVPCSVSLQDMAKKFHVTLMDECEVME